MPLIPFVENSHDGVLMLNAGRQVVYVSPSYARINGFSPEEWLGAYGPDYIHPDDQATTASVFRDLVEEPARWHRSSTGCVIHPDDDEP